MRKFTKVSIALMTLLAGSVAHAAVSQNSMTLQWQGVIPLAPSTTGPWKFVDPVDSTKDFVPLVGSINVSNGTTAGTKTLSLSPVNFGVASATGLTASSPINAYLAYAVNVNGLNPSATVTPGDVASFTLQANAVTLKEGAVNSIKVADAPTTADANNVSLIAVTGTGSVGQSAYTEGDNMVVNAVLVFTADAI